LRPEGSEAVFPIARRIGENEVLTLLETQKLSLMSFLLNSGKSAIPRLEKIIHDEQNDAIKGLAYAVLGAMYLYDNQYETALINFKSK
jgi:hypothetical protein